MKAKKNAAAETTHTAADQAAAFLDDAKTLLAAHYEQGRERIAPYWEEGRGRVTPYLEQSRERITPYVSQSREKLTPYLEQGRDKVAPYVAQSREYVSQGREKLGPAAHEAKVRSAVAAGAALESLHPHVTDALDKVAPAIESLKQGIDELTPRLTSALNQAAGGATVQDNEHSPMVAALKGELDVPQEKAKKRVKIWLPLLLITGLAGAAFYAWKKFMSPGASDWEQHNATAYNVDTEKSTTQSFGEPVDVPAGEGEVPGAGVADAAGVGASPSAAAAGTAGAAAAAGAGAGNKYGKDAYIGAEPPEGFTIKGNERSMKYHTPETGGYERTIADVWFTSEEAAKAAGFAKAQR